MLVYNVRQLGLNHVLSACAVPPHAGSRFHRNSYFSHYFMFVTYRCSLYSGVSSLQSNAESESVQAFILGRVDS